MRSRRRSPRGSTEIDLADVGDNAGEHQLSAFPLSRETGSGNSIHPCVTRHLIGAQRTALDHAIAKRHSRAAARAEGVSAGRLAGRAAWSPVCSTTSSARPIVSRLSATRGPPSLKTRVIPRSASRRSAASRSSRPVLRARPARPPRPSPLQRRAASFREHPRPAMTSRRRLARRRGETRARRQRQPPVEHDAQRLRALSTPGSRTVISGSSSRAVPEPIMIASCSDRCTWVKASAIGTGDVQARIVLAAGGIAVGGLGEFQRHHRPALGDAQNVAEMIATRGGGLAADDRPRCPLRADSAWPLPATRGSGSSIAVTTRATPDGDDRRRRRAASRRDASRAPASRKASRRAPPRRRRRARSPRRAGARRAR